MSNTGTLQVYHPANQDKCTRAFRGAGLVAEERVLTPLREWFMEKPTDGRIITRTCIEVLMGVSPRDKNVMQIRKEITMICNKYFRLYSPNTNTKSWVITGEVFK